MTRARWRRLGLRAGLGLLILIAVLIGATRLALWATLNARSDRIASAIRAARSVRLEQFLDDKVLATRELDAEQRAAAIASVRGNYRGGTIVSLSMCFVPHHRIVATDARGVEFTFTVCFECDQAKFTGSELFDLPESWSEALRQLFGRVGMPISEANQ